MNDVGMAAAFLSYARFNDKHDEDRLTHFCAKLAGEVETVTGDEFRIFQDRRDIRTGQDWKDRITETIDSTMLLIAILTPTFFRRPECIAEVRRFLDRERTLARSDLIIPIYYVDVPQLAGTEAGSHGLFEVIRRRQYFDWRELRFEELDSVQARRALNRVAIHIREALERFPSRSSAAGIGPAHTSSPDALAETEQPSHVAPPAPAPTAERTIQSVGAVNQPASLTEPPTHVVDALRGPNFTVAQAVSIAGPGDRILVRPGTYEEGVVLDKPLEILGQGDPGEVVVQATGGNALAFRTTLGRVAHVTLRQLGGGDYFAVDIGQGRLTLEGCRIESASLAGIAIHGGGADPIVRNNQIRRCRQSGIVVFDSARGTIEENNVHDNDAWGIVIRDGSSPLLRGNQIHDNGHGGVCCERSGLGRVEDNAIFDNRREGVVIQSHANPQLRQNTIYRNTKAGVYAHGHGEGTLEDNEIRDNQNSGVAIRTEANPTVQRNRINRNNGKGVWCQAQAAGIVTSNDLRDNKYGAFWKSDDSTTRYSDNQE